MSSERKVVWNEGTVIAPQHIQQLERYYDAQINQHYAASHSFGWGLIDLQLNTSSLKLGTVSVDRIVGYLPDGSYFNETIDSAPSLVLNIPPNVEDEFIFIAWSMPSSYKRNYAFVDETNNENVRYLLKNVEIEDSTDANLPKRELLIAAPNLRLALARNLNDQDIKMPIARIASVSTTGDIRLDDNFIPASLDTKNNLQLNNYQTEILGLLKQKALALGGVLNNPTLKGTGDVRDFLMLQTINRYFAYMHNVTSSSQSTHPFSLFENFLKLYGDLSTFHIDKLNFNLPIYDHDQLNKCFKQIVTMLREVLSIVLQQRAIMIPLELRDEATRVALTPETSMLNSCSFVLAINASMPSEVLRQRIPTTIKISSVEKVRDLIAYHLPGIHVHALSTAPRELPYHSGYSYFEIDKGSELWQDLEQSAGMAIHLAGEFPDLDIECWAIKNY